jgi:nucleoside-triphosphatase THEP1
MTALTESVPVLVITGPVGVGKTAVATEVSELLARAVDTEGKSIAEVAREVVQRSGWLPA